MQEEKMQEEKIQEEKKQEVKKVSRKEWVKNAAIIFLSIMLVLTFFSNTIMNYSLPEVATAMIEPGSITAKIRGTGNLTSEEPYKITIQETRKIASVAVKAGDEVEKDQVLFYLEDKESTELEEAKNALNELILAYSSSILSGEISEQSYENIQEGKVTDNNEYQLKINEAKQKVESAQATVESLEKQIMIMETTDYSKVDKQSELDNAKRELEKAKEELTGCQEKLAAATEQSGGDISQLTEDKYAKEALWKEKKEVFDGEKKKLQEAMDVLLGNLDEPFNITVKEYEDIANINKYLAKLNEYYEEVPDLNGDGSNNEANKQAAAEAMGAFRKAFEEALAAEIEYENASKLLQKAIAANTNLPSLQQAVTKAKNYVNECQAKVDALENEFSDNSKNSEKQLAEIKLQKEEAIKTVDKAKEELSQLLTDVSKELDLGNQNSIIREQREKIAKLQENAVGAAIKAPIAGTVVNINKIAGEEIAPQEEIAIMQPEGKGYTMSFSVTQEQAKKVTVGEKAEIQNSWYYNDIQATLIGIRPDPESNGTKKLLVFSVIGDVQNGQSVSVSIGQRSASYDLLVPNSAVREDNNGKFILIVESKNSPLGNRYMATRVDVEVLGSDDTKTAISAPLYGYEYVITTASQPVEAGKQIRLAEN